MSRPGLSLWGPVGRWVFLNWPRGSWQYDLVCAVIIAGLFVLPGAQGRPGPLTLDEVLAAMDGAYDTVESFKADIDTVSHDPLFDDEEVERGTLAYLKPSYVRREIVEPAIRTELVAGGEIQVYIPRVKQVQVMEVDVSAEAQRLAVPGLASAADLRASYEIELREVVPGRAGDPSSYVLRLMPRPGSEAAKRYASITLEVVEGAWYPARRIVLEELAGVTHTVTLSDVDTDVDLERDDFVLDLPSDVKIVRQGSSS